MSINIIILTGRLTEDPGLKYTQSGKPYARFTVAVSRRHNREETDFISVVAWEKKAELASQYLKKGSLVGVTGSLRVRSYEDENNLKKKITEVLVENLEFLESKKGDNFGGEYTPKSQTNNSGQSSDDDFPF